MRGFFERARAALAGDGDALLRGWKARNAMAGSDLRRQRLDALERLYQGKQYAGLEEWDLSGDDAKRTPLSKRRPGVRGGLAGEIVDRYLALFGLPSFRVPGDPDAEKLLARALDVGLWPGAFRDGLRYGLCPGSGPIGFSLRFGWPLFRVFYPGLCVPRFAESEPKIAAAFGLQPNDLAFLRVLYDDDDVDPETGKRRRVWIREELYPDRIVRFERLPVRWSGGEEGKGDALVPDLDDWKVDEERSVVHGWGFVSVEWLRPLGEHGGEVDGPCLLGEPDGELASLAAEWDYILSHAGRSARRNCVPTPVVRGVSRELLKSFNPAQPLIITDPQGGLDYKGTDGAGVERAHEHADRVEGRAYDRARVVRLDPEKGGEPSGEALRLKFAPMLAEVSAWRAEIGPQIRRLASRLLRAIYVETGRLPRRVAKELFPEDPRAELELEELADGAPERIAEELFERDPDDDGEGDTLAPTSSRVVLGWPPVFPMTLGDLQKAADALGKLSAAELLPAAAAVRYLVAAGFPAESAEALLEELATEIEERTKREGGEPPPTTRER